MLAIDFASRGATVYSFEMDHKNYQNILPLAKKHHFTIENMGLGLQEFSAEYNPKGAASRMVALGGVDNGGG